MYCISIGYCKKSVSPLLTHWRLSFTKPSIWNNSVAHPHDTILASNWIYIFFYTTGPNAKAKGSILPLSFNVIHCIICHYATNCAWHHQHPLYIWSGYPKMMRWDFYARGWHLQPTWSLWHPKTFIIKWWISNMVSRHLIKPWQTSHLQEGVTKVSAVYYSGFQDEICLLCCNSQGHHKGISIS